jgi:ferredoxin-NADP reductase
VASPPGGDTIELTVEMVPGGEVSGFLDQVVETGDQLEVRGPLGYFTWGGATPMLGVAGGSGLVPLMSMLRQARTTDRADLVKLLVSARGPDELYYTSELPGPETTIVYTRRTPVHHPRPAGRFDATDLAPLLTEAQDVYVCGSAGFCEAVTTTLSGLCVPAARIRVERFGPSG